MQDPEYRTEIATTDGLHRIKEYVLIAFPFGTIDSHRK